MSDRWSIYIDLEGFSALWEKEDQILLSLGELMRSIFRVGRHCYPEPPDRLFAHQFGDGFVVVSDFHETSLERCATIAVALMQHVAASGRLARAAIAEGQMAGIQGCYPSEVLDCLEGDHTVSLHMGLMTITPVMGTALIRAVGVDKRAPRGPLLVIEASKAERLGALAPWTEVCAPELASIDWIHVQTDLLRTIQTNAKLDAPSAESLETRLRIYCREQAVPEPWRANVGKFLRVA
jgi:hypothetical protein